MKKIYLLLFAFTSFFGFSQTPLSVEKLHQVNTFNGGALFKTVFDDQANNITVGFANGPFSIGSEDFSTQGANSLFIHKTNSQNGNTVWRKIISPLAAGSIQPYLLYSHDSQTYIGVEIKGTVVINGQSYNSQDKNWMVIKLDEAGNVLWVSPTAQMIKGEYFDISDSSGRVFVLMNNSVFQIDASNGSLLSSFSHSNLTLTSVETSTDAVLLGGKVKANTTVGTESLTKDAAVVLKSDFSYNVNSSLQFYGTPSSFNHIADLALLADGTLSFVGLSAHKVTAYGEGGLIVPCDYSMSGDQGNLYIGRVSPDFTDMKWLGGNPVVSVYPIKGVAQLYSLPPNNVGLYFSPAQAIEQPNNYFFYHSDVFVPHNTSVMITYDENGNKSSDYPLFTGNLATEFSSIMVGSSIYNGSVAKNNIWVYHAQDNSSFQLNYTHQVQSVKGSVFAQKVKTQPDGSFYIDAVTQGTLLDYFGEALDPPTQSYLRTVSKINADGSQSWMKGVEGVEINSSTLYHGRSSIFTSEGNSLLASRCRPVANCRLYVNDNLLDIPGTAANVLLTSFLDSGVLAWTKNISGAFSYHSLFQHKGDYFITGVVNNPFTINNVPYNVPAWVYSVVIIKVTGSGNIDFVKIFPNIEVYENMLLSFDEQDNIYAFMEPQDYGVNQHPEFEFGNVTIPRNPSGTNLLMIKFDGNGNALLGKNFILNTSSPGAFLSDVKFNGSEFVLYGGLYRSGNAVYGLGGVPYQLPAELQNTSAHNYIAKISKNGDLIWETPILSKAFNYGRIDIDMHNNVFVYGYWKELLSVKGQEINLSPADLSLDVLKFTDQGTLGSRFEIGTMPPISGTMNAPQNLDIEVRPSGGIVISGNTEGTGILDEVVNHQNGHNIYIAFLEESVLKTEQNILQKLTVYPNPTSDYISINSNNTILRIDIYDATGRKINVKAVSASQLDVRNLINGVYYITVVTDSYISSTKFIKN